MKYYLLLSSQYAKDDAVLFDAIAKKCVKRVMDFTGEDSKSCKNHSVLRNYLEQRQNNVVLYEVNKKKFDLMRASDLFQDPNYILVDKHVSSLSTRSKNDRQLFVEMSVDVLSEDWNNNRCKIFYLSVGDK